MRKRLLLAAVIIMISGLSHESVYANPGMQLDSDKLRGEIEVLINEERVRYGAAELITNDTLVENAQLRAKEVEEVYPIQDRTEINFRQQLQLITCRQEKILHISILLTSLRKSS